MFLDRSRYSIDDYCLLICLDVHWLNLDAYGIDLDVQWIDLDFPWIFLDVYCLDMNAP